jgi:hypothetical protein
MLEEAGVGACEGAVLAAARQCSLMKSNTTRGTEMRLLALLHDTIDSVRFNEWAEHCLRSTTIGHASLYGTFFCKINVHKLMETPQNARELILNSQRSNPFHTCRFVNT